MCGGVLTAGPGITLGVTVGMTPCRWPDYIVFQIIMKIGFKCHKHLFFGFSIKLMDGIVS